MDMKNTTILLIFLLCILGLIIGTCYTESTESNITWDDSDEAVHEDSDEPITMGLELKGKKGNSLEDIFI